MNKISLLEEFIDEEESFYQRAKEGLERHKERYLKAWIAKTGVDPEEAELVEEISRKKDKVTYRYWIRKRK